MLKLAKDPFSLFSLFNIFDLSKKLVSEPKKQDKDLVSLFFHELKFFSFLSFELYFDNY